MALEGMATTTLTGEGYNGYRSTYNSDYYYPNYQYWYPDQYWLPYTYYYYPPIIYCPYCGKELNVHKCGE